MYQLQNLINRSAVPKDPGTNMKAAEDYLLTVVYAHILMAAETIEAFTTPDSVSTLAKSIIANYVLLPTLDKKKVAEAWSFSKVP